MRSHWPIAVALALISLAWLAGRWQQARKGGGPPGQAPQNARPAESKAESLAPAAPPEPLRPAPAATAPLKAEPKASVPSAGAPSAILQLLKSELQTRAGATLRELPNGAYAAELVGGRVEVSHLPNWSINIYNNNPTQPQVETEAFKKLFEATAAVLGIDLSVKPLATDNGKSYMKSATRLGTASVVRDPANGNSYLIRPLGPVQVPAPKAPLAHPPAVVPPPDTRTKDKEAF